MKRTPCQNDLFHPLCRQIAKHLSDSGAPTSEAMVKELVLHHFAPATKYTRGGLVYSGPKRSSGLSIEEMNDVISKMDAWAATDLNLDLNLE